MVLDLLFLSWLFFLSWLYFCPLRRVNMRMAMTAAVHVTPTTTPIMMYVVVVCDNSRRESIIIRSMVNGQLCYPNVQDWTLNMEM